MSVRKIFPATVAGVFTSVPVMLVVWLGLLPPMQRATATAMQYRTARPAAGAHGLTGPNHESTGS
jgi:hypothetical protein